MNSFTSEQKNLLKKVAREAIEGGLQTGQLKPKDFSKIEDSKLLQHQASFVTLEIKNQLRGCIGHLEPVQPLLQDVYQNAYQAAFQDPRFPPLSRQEYSRIRLSLSILSSAQKIDFSSEEDLLSKIRPQKDGLILLDKPYRGTFLPSVWKSLPETKEFWRHLKQKAGLPSDYWSDTLEVFRYSTTIID